MEVNMRIKAMGYREYTIDQRRERSAVRKVNNNSLLYICIYSRIRITKYGKGQFNNWWREKYYGLQKRKGI